MGETLIGGPFGMTGGGKGSNQALAASRLGAKAYMIGCVGDDDFGSHLRSILEENGVDCSHLESHSEAPTGTAVVTVVDSGERSIVLSQGANSLLSKEVLARAEDVFRECDTALFQMETPPEVVAAGLETARRLGCKTFLSADPPFSLPDSVWKSIDCMVLNQMALGTYVPNFAFRETTPNDAAIAGAARVLLDRGVGSVVVTRSARGGIMFTKDKTFAFDPFKVHIVDNTGARDAFCAGLCVGLSEGMQPETAAKFASIAGALACRRIGAHTSMPWRHEVESRLSQDENDMM